MTELLALGAALCFACAVVSAKLASGQANMFLGLVVSLGTGTIVIGTYSIATVDDWSVSRGAALVFVLAGITGPGLGRILMFKSVKEAGATVAAPLEAAVKPIAGVAAGRLLFGEAFTFYQSLGLALVTIGVWRISLGGSSNRALEQDGEVTAPRRGTRLVADARINVLVWPIATGLAYALADVLRKYGLEVSNTPSLGALLGMIAAMLFWSIYSVVNGGEVLSGTGLSGTRYYAMNGFFAGLAQLLLFAALGRGDLSQVVPIVSAQPIFVVLFGGLFLRAREHIRPGVLTSTVLIATGISAIILFRVA